MCYLFAEREKTHLSVLLNASGCDVSTQQRAAACGPTNVAGAGAGAGANAGVCENCSEMGNGGEPHGRPTVGRWGCEWPS